MREKPHPYTIVQQSTLTNPNYTLARSCFCIEPTLTFATGTTLVLALKIRLFHRHITTLVTNQSQPVNADLIPNFMQNLNNLAHLMNHNSTSLFSRGVTGQLFQIVFWCKFGLFLYSCGSSGPLKPFLPDTNLFPTLPSLILDVRMNYFVIHGAMCGAGAGHVSFPTDTPISCLNSVKACNV